MDITTAAKNLDHKLKDSNGEGHVIQEGTRSIFTVVQLQIKHRKNSEAPTGFATSMILV